LTEENLRLACDALIPFAHWVTPTFMPSASTPISTSRATPEGQLGRHDGSESVDSVWVNPTEAMTDKRWTIIFPTKMNLLKLAHGKTAEEALAIARKTPVVTVIPEVVKRAEGSFLTIPKPPATAKSKNRCPAFAVERRATTYHRNRVGVVRARSSRRLRLPDRPRSRDRRKQRHNARCSGARFERPKN